MSGHLDEDGGLDSAHNIPLLPISQRELEVDGDELSSLKDEDDEARPFVENLEDNQDGQDPSGDKFAADPFRPFDDLPNERRHILTIRAISVGIFCGALVNASNIYLGLKSGWTSGANLFASIIGFAVLRFCAKHANHIPILGGNFGPRENNIVQTTATAAGGMSNVFVSAFPAMYQLGLLNSPQKDLWRIITLTAVGGYFGLLFATPLRQFFIIQVARDLRLIFPSSSATAITIRGMHLAADGGSMAQRKMRALVLAFSFACIVRVLSQYAIGLLWDWHLFTWMYLMGIFQDLAIALESWGWFIEWTPAFIGSGMLVGMNVAISFSAGSLLAWGIIGPILVAKELAFGRSVSKDPLWDSVMDYASLSSEFTSVDHPSPRYWLLWPGVLCMIFVSFTELACQWRIFWLSSRMLWRSVVEGFRRFFPRSQKKVSPSTGAQVEDNLPIKDPASTRDMVKTWMWLPALIILLILACFVMSIQYDMPIGESLLALFLAFFFSFLAIQSTGATDITPLTAASKASQVILGATTKGRGWTVERAQTLNLMGGALASIGAGQAADLTGDFRVGFLLRTSPKLQWFAQGIGTAVAVFLAPTMYVLFSVAYPCINEVSSKSCPFTAPSASAWRAVAVAVVDPTLPIPVSSRYFAIGFALFGSAMVLVRQYLWIGKREWMRKYHPNMMVISLAFIVPATVYGTAMLIGALIASIWARRNPQSFEMLGYAVAAGLMAGEGIGGVINAVFQILGISGTFYGTQIGCPADAC